ncbi:MAG: hypothetical protein JNM65_13020 [Verrucomicrobiaceae bacterium]|nr:hypothetical protein [Verrucomicrobiaceae bacterium]
MKNNITILAAALLLSNCTYHTYVVPPKPAPKPSTPVRRVTTTHSSSPDDFKAITKPSTYSH